jgi:hypothetical protein
MTGACAAGGATGAAWAGSGVRVCCAGSGVRVCCAAWAGCGVCVGAASCGLDVWGWGVRLCGVACGLRAGTGVCGVPDRGVPCGRRIIGVLTLAGSVVTRGAASSTLRERLTDTRLCCSAWWRGGAGSRAGSLVSPRRRVEGDDIAEW